MIRIVLFVVVALMVLGTSGCILGGDDDGEKNTSSPVAVTLEGVSAARVNDLIEVTARYSVDYPADHSYTREFNLQGSFNTTYLDDVFEFVSGEPRWSETVKSFEEHEHTIVLRALKRGQFGIVVGIDAPIAEGHAAGWTAGLVVTVK